MNKFIIAKPGKNVFKVTSPDDLNLSSDFGTLKYFYSGNYTMTNVSTTTNVTIPHNLGYVPFFICYVNDIVAQPNNYGLTEYLNSIGGQLRALRSYVDANNLYLSANLGVSTPVTIKWYYKVFINNLNL